MQINQIKDSITFLVTVIGVPGGLLAAWKAIEEMKYGREEKAKETRAKERENRHKQAAAARDAMNQIFGSDKSRAALQMLDWSGRTYTDGKQEFTIYSSDLCPALRIDHLQFAPKELFIRECFDDLFSHLELLQHYAEIEFINPDDISVPFVYYAKKITCDPSSFKVFENFLDEYGYPKAKKFLLRASHDQR